MAKLPASFLGIKKFLAYPRRKETTSPFTPFSGTSSNIITRILEPFLIAMFISEDDNLVKNRFDLDKANIFLTLDR